MTFDSKNNGSESRYFYSHSPFYHGMAYWENVFENSARMNVKKKYIVFTQESVNKSVYLIYNGRIRLSLIDKEGNEKAIILIQEGNIFGKIYPNDQIPHIFTATAVVDSVLLYMPSEVFLSKVVSNAVLSERLILELSYMNRILAGHIGDIYFMDAKERVITYLSKLSDIYGVDTYIGRKISIKFTHQEMADLVGACRVTVTKIMNSLQKLKVIKKINGHVYIIDVSYLEKMVEDKF